jgi:hypothetical protein
MSPALSPFAGLSHQWKATSLCGVLPLSSPENLFSPPGSPDFFQVISLKISSLKKFYHKKDSFVKRKKALKIKDL